MENNDLLGRESISEFRNGSLFENQGLGVSKLSCHAEQGNMVSKKMTSLETITFL
jgi:hypothetical protein